MSPAAAAPDRPAVAAHGHRFGHASDARLRRPLAARIDPRLRHARGRVTVMLQLTQQPAIRRFVSVRSTRGRSAAVTAQRVQTDRILDVERRLTARLDAPATRATRLFSVQTVYAGVAVATDAKRLSALARLPGVAAVRPLVPKRLENSATVPLIKATDVWAATGNTGSGEKIGIIDTGIDYTHADFGGPGTVAAYTAARQADSAAPVFPQTAKVAGGYDFAGDSYNPDTGDDVPQPDPNPLDCDGHGTHVAGTAGGYGVTADGRTYTGPYDASLDESQFRIGPGVAPGATLYALKVFGCAGGTSTDLITEALDWSVSHHLDVVNLSLGSDFSSLQDPDAVAADNAALAGVSVVAAAGNAGDSFDVAGSPGNARRAIAVAASDDYRDVVDGITVNGQVQPAEQSIKYDWTRAGAGVTGPVESAGDFAAAPTASNNVDGCDPFPAHAFDGHVGLLSFSPDDVQSRCGTAAATDNAAAAGATGVIFGYDQDEMDTGINGDTRIPAVLTPKSVRDNILAALTAGGPVTATLDNSHHNSVVQSHPATTDRLAGFSSRGLGTDGVLKPDVTAPGFTVFSAAVGTGSDGVSYSGTSMASPHVAGVAALVRAAHPGWTPEQVKAAIMDTALQDVYVGSNQTGQTYAPMRVGAGRVRADLATATAALAYSADGAGGVGVSFGPVAATGSLIRTKTVTVQNTAATAVTYNVAYVADNTNPGAQLAVSPSAVTVPAGGTAAVTVTLTVNPAQLVDRPDPTLQLHPLGDGLTRSFVSDVSGRVTFTLAGSSRPALRLPVYAAPRPASTMTQPGTVTTTRGGALRRTSLTLRGQGVDQPAVASGDASYESVVDAYELQATSPALPLCTSGKTTSCIESSAPDERAADLAAVGVASDVPAYRAAGLNPFTLDPYGDGSDAYADMYFGIATRGDWRTPVGTFFQVLLDTNGDGRPDAMVYNTGLVGTDVFVAELATVQPDGQGGWEPKTVLDDELLNASDGSLDTGAYDSNVMTLPVALYPLAAQHLISTTSSVRIHYWVDSFALDFGSPTVFDSVGDVAARQRPLAADIARPALMASDPSQCGHADCLPVLNVDQPGTTLDVRTDVASLAYDRPLGLLLLHHDNVAAVRAQVVHVRQPTSLAVTAAARNFFGAHPQVTVTVTPRAATGQIAVRLGNRTLATGSLSNGQAHLRLLALTVGAHDLTVTYAGAGDYVGSTAHARLVVAKARSRTRLGSSTSHPVAGRPLTLTAVTRVVAGAARLSGTVTFRDNGTPLATVREHRSGWVSVRRRLSAGRHRITVVYRGSATVAPSMARRTLHAS